MCYVSTRHECPREPVRGENITSLPGRVPGLIWGNCERVIQLEPKVTDSDQIGEKLKCFRPTSMPKKQLKRLNNTEPDQNIKLCLERNMQNYVRGILKNEQNEEMREVRGMMSEMRLSSTEPEEIDVSREMSKLWMRKEEKLPAAKQSLLLWREEDDIDFWKGLNDKAVGCEEDEDSTNHFKRIVNSNDNGKKKRSKRGGGWLKPNSIYEGPTDLRGVSGCGSEQGEIVIKMYQDLSALQNDSTRNNQRGCDKGGIATNTYQSLNVVESESPGGHLWGSAQGRIATKVYPLENESPRENY